MAVEARYFLGGQGFSARFADFVPRGDEVCGAHRRLSVWESALKALENAEAASCGQKRAQAREEPRRFLVSKAGGTGAQVQRQTEQIQ